MHRTVWHKRAGVPEVKFPPNPEERVRGHIEYCPEGTRYQCRMREWMRHRMGREHASEMRRMNVYLGLARAGGSDGQIRAIVTWGCGTLDNDHLGIEAVEDC
jgi:hypothetical protein